MAQNTEVLVRDKQTLQELTITYQAYKDVSSRFDLLGQWSNGQFVEGDPNLLPQHRRKSANVIAGSVGIPAPMSQEEIEERRKEIISRMPALQEIPKQKGEPQIEEIKEPVKAEEPKSKRKYTKRVKETA